MRMKLFLLNQYSS